MKFYSISDLHLSTTVDKPMDIFGGQWENYWEDIKNDWRSRVTQEDVVLISGDISWATKMQDAVSDLKLIDELPGRKVIIKGNHDYWWGSYSKVNSVLPPGITAIQNNALTIGEKAVCGTRLWNICGKTEQDKTLIDRETIRLKLTLDAAKALDKPIVLMTHYPPFNAAFEDNAWTDMISEYGVECVVYGHLHGKKTRSKPVVNKQGIDYYLTSCDMVNNRLVLLPIGE